LSGLAGRTAGLEDHMPMWNLRTRRRLQDVPPAGILRHQHMMCVWQAVMGPSLYLHAHTVDVRKSPLISGFLKSGLL
jgi:hypothetical protein